MSPRDEQDYEAKRQQIIDGALAVFSEHGFEKATNKEIARAAGINSPGLIYHYFKDKTDLFQQMVEERASALQLLVRSDNLMEKEPREVLTLFGNAFMQMMGKDVPIAMFKMMLSEAALKPSVAAMFNRIGPWRGFTFLARYLQHQMDLGTLKRMDAGAASRCFLGPLMAFVLTREVFIQDDAATLTPEVMVSTAIEVFMNGMSAR